MDAAARPVRLPAPSWRRRSLYAFGAVMVMADMLGTAALGLWAQRSLSHVAAALTGLGDWLSLGFAVSAAALLPFVAAQLRAGPQARWPVLLLCTGCFAAALLWVGVAYVARNADLAVLRLMYLWQGVSASALMLLVAANCNAALRSAQGLDDVRPRSWRASNRIPLE